MNAPSIRITIFYCSNALQEEDLYILSSKCRDIKINSISLPCSGKVSSLYLLKTIETGSDSVLLVSCKFGSCKYLQGNYRASKRMQDIEELLYETGMSRGTVSFTSLEGEDKIDTVLSAIRNIAESLEAAQQESQKQSI